MKELKKQIIEAVQDAIDTEDGTVSIPTLDHFLDEILTEQYYIADVKRGFFQEFDYPLDNFQRKWLRRSLTLLYSPILIIAGALFGAFELSKQWFNECW